MGFEPNRSTYRLSDAQQDDFSNIIRFQDRHMNLFIFIESEVMDTSFISVIFKDAHKILHTLLSFSCRCLYKCQFTTSINYIFCFIQPLFPSALTFTQHNVLSFHPLSSHSDILLVCLVRKYSLFCRAFFFQNHRRKTSNFVLSSFLMVKSQHRQHSKTSFLHSQKSYPTVTALCLQNQCKHKYLLDFWQLFFLFHNFTMLIILIQQLNRHCISRKFLNGLKCRMYVRFHQIATINVAKYCADIKGLGRR